MCVCDPFLQIHSHMIYINLLKCFDLLIKCFVHCKYDSCIIYVMILSKLFVNKFVSVLVCLWNDECGVRTSDNYVDMHAYTHMHIIVFLSFHRDWKSWWKITHNSNMKEPVVSMDTRSFNGNGDINVVVDKNHTVSMVKNESRL